MKKLLWGMALLLLISFPADAEQKYSLSGTASFDQAERILISLYTYEEFQNYLRKPLPPEPFTLVIEPSAQEKGAGKVPFRFDGIPQGTYALLAFRDQDKPGTLRRSVRPASSYLMMTFSGRWDDVKFEVNRNITGLKIRFEGKRESKP
jgi:hypothetical protein